MCSECMWWLLFIVVCVVDSVWFSICLLNIYLVLMLWFWLWNRLFFRCLSVSRLISLEMMGLCVLDKGGN